MLSGSHPSREIVIIGGGIIGCTTAYYLSRHSYFQSGNTVTLIEASKRGPAQGASGKAGGLVAKWAYPKELADLSFTEHVKLAEELNGKDRWGWRYVGCGSWEGRGEAQTEQGLGSGVGYGGEKKSLEKTLGLDGGDEVPSKSKKMGLPDDLLWVKEELTDAYSPMAPNGATAQVHPYQFTMSMFELAKKNGVAYVQGTATSIIQSNGAVTGVKYSDPSGNMRTIPATHVVLAGGAWSPSLYPGLPISATRAHSITIRPLPNVNIAPYVLFTDITLPSSTSKQGTSVSPEIYARPDNEVYACGPGDDSCLPSSVDEVLVDESACDSIREHVASISQQLQEGAIEKRQACFLPTVSTGGGPIIGETDTKGLILATGHTCWVISFLFYI